MCIAVSVICIVYNHEKFLKKTLDGLVNQKTNFQYEILVHDDASTDNSKKIIEIYTVQYPNLIIPIYQDDNKYSKGEYILFDYLVPRIRGKYVAFCEGDDYWSNSEKLQMQYDALEKNASCGMCVHKVQCCTEDGQLLPLFFPPEDLAFRQGVINKSNVVGLLYNKGLYPFHTSSYMLRSDILRDSNNINIKEMSYFDIGLLRLGILMGDFYYIEQHMSVRRIMESDSWNVRYKKASVIELKKIYERWMDLEMAFAEESGGAYESEIAQRMYNLLFSFLWRTENNKLFQEMWDQYGNMLMKCNHFGTKQRMIMKMMKNWPAMIIFLKHLRSILKKG